jgi:GNAT superfamily N-acetyltransferase
MAALLMPTHPAATPASMLQQASDQLARLLRPWMELRIDVHHHPDDIEAELAALHRRLNTPGDCLHGIDTLPALRPGLVFHYREADGEHYVYVEDPARGVLAGYTVFNRLIEVNRRADRHLRSPHSRYAPSYQRRGIASAVYEWALARGFCLVSGARQSVGAHALWCALARRHSFGYLDIRAQRIRHLGSEVDPVTRDDLHTRMILLGQGWDLARLRDEAGVDGADT